MLAWCGYSLRMTKPTTSRGQLALIGVDEEMTEEHPHAAQLTDAQLVCRAGGTHAYPDRHNAQYQIDRERSAEAGQLLARLDLPCSCGVVKSSWITVPNCHPYGSPRMDYSNAEGYLQSPEGDLAERANYRLERLSRQLGRDTVAKYKRMAAQGKGLPARY